MTNPLALIIEDNKQLATIFAQTLQLAEFKTETIFDGTTSLARLAETIPALVILDLHLPGTSGEKILEQIRADTRLAKTRVILATADALLAERTTKPSRIGFA